MTLYSSVDRSVRGLRLSCIASAIAVILSLPGGVQAQDYFNPALLEQNGDASTVNDLSAFTAGGQLPGTYRVDIFLNGQQADSRDVNFFRDEHNTLQPCLSVDELALLGVRVENYPKLQPPGLKCADLSAIEGSRAAFIFSSQRLDLSFPQVAVKTLVRGYVPPSQWDEGINAAILNYGFSGIRDLAHSGHDRGDSQFLSLRPGVNLGAWRLRNFSTWTQTHGQDGQWNNVYTYAQRNIIPLRSQLVLGDSNAPSEVFDSVPFRGVQLASDDEMLPDSLRGYAPIIRGIARSNSAQVIVRQNGYVIYQTTVAAGAFEITDMYPTGGNGDLHVTVEESDGSVQNMIVPFASLPVLQREGRLRFSLTGGQYRSYDHSVGQQPFLQGTAIYGLTQGLTVYGGVQASDHYRSVAAGLGQNIGTWGAVSADITHSQGKADSEPAASGQAMRLRYSKSLAETGTYVTIAGYRYATDGFYTLSDVLDTYRSQGGSPRAERKRNRAELTLNQDLGEDHGYLTAGAVQENYWNSNLQTASYSMGYTNSWNGISYSMNYAYNRNTGVSSGSRGQHYERDQVLSLSVSIPLSRWMGNTYASYSLTHSKSGGTLQSAGLAGTALADNNLNWGVSQSAASNGRGNSGYARASYRATYGELNGGYSYGRDQKSLNYGVEGALVAHADGLTAGQPVGETFALVKVPGADGVSINNRTGVSTDFRGYALVPDVMPFRRNDLTLNTQTLKDNVDLKQTSQHVVPTRGAVVRAQYSAQVGQRALMTLSRPGGHYVPFGATVTNVSQPDAGSIVGDGGQVYLTGLAEEGQLLVQWGKTADRQCRVSYRLKSAQNAAGLVTLQGICQ